MIKVTLWINEQRTCLFSRRYCGKSWTSITIHKVDSRCTKHLNRSGKLNCCLDTSNVMLNASSSPGCLPSCWSSFLLMRLESSGWWPKHLGYCNHLGDLRWSSRPLLQPDPAQGVVDIWGRNQWMEELYFSSLSLIPCLSNKQTLREKIFTSQSRKTTFYKSFTCLCIWKADKQSSLPSGFTPKIPAMVGTQPGRSQELNSGLSHRSKESSYFSHHHCQIVPALARSWRQEPEPGSDPTHSIMSQGQVS